ncbi:MAG: DNRLRE domain-containing protein [Planctomycetota bacterium]
MNGKFDPYYKWLAIPPEEQPPDHYRLLGIPQFTDDLDVIENLAEQRIRHIRSYQIGPKSEEATELLNELAAARACLLDVERKSRYDAALQKQLANVQAIQVESVSAIPGIANFPASNRPAIKPPAAYPEFIEQPARSASSRHTRSRSKPFPWAFILVGSFLGVSIIGAGAIWRSRANSSDTSSEGGSPLQAVVIDPTRPSENAFNPSKHQNDAVTTDAPSDWSSVITTREGQGGDAMVQRNQPDRFGSDPLLGVRADSKVEVAHSYLRFDLSQIAPNRRRKCSIKLVLSVLGRSLPKNGELRIHGIDDMSWSEAQLDWNRSRSTEPFADESLLLVSPIGSEHVALGTIASEIHLSSQAFRDFIAECGPTVTLVISGNVGDRQWLRFTSGEHSSQYAPKLRFQMPGR